MARGSGPRSQAAPCIAAALPRPRRPTWTLFGPLRRGTLVDCSPGLPPLPALRAQPAAGVLLDEDVGIELSDPEAPLGGFFQVTQGRADIRLDAGPEEPRVLLGEVRGILAAHLLGDPDLVQLEVEGGELAQVGWVGE